MPLHGVCRCPMTKKSVIDRLLRPICEGTEPVQLALNQVKASFHSDRENSKQPSDLDKGMNQFRRDLRPPAREVQQTQLKPLISRRAFFVRNSFCLFRACSTIIFDGYIYCEFNRNLAEGVVPIFFYSFPDLRVFDS